MRYFFFLSLGLLGLAACVTSTSQSSPPPPQLTEMAHWGTYFQQRGIEGCFVLQKVGTHERKLWHAARAKTPYSPASTFKVPNSLFALQAGAIPDEETIIPWDSVERQLQVWNQDHHLRSAIKHSTVWFYQEMARRIGPERMQQYLDTIQYGNGDISDGIDLFWLRGSLKISAQDQVDFLAKLEAMDLPFDQGHMETVHDIMIREVEADYTLRAKTGWAIRHEGNLGWLVGWLTRKEGTYLFAMNIDMPDDSLAKARWDISREIFRAEGLMP